MKPKWIQKNTYKIGVGHPQDVVALPIIMRSLVKMCAKIIAARLAPVRWHLAAVFGQEVQRQGWAEIGTFGGEHVPLGQVFLSGGALRPTATATATCSTPA